MLQTMLGGPLLPQPHSSCSEPACLPGLCSEQGFWEGREHPYHRLGTSFHPRCCSRMGPWAFGYGTGDCCGVTSPAGPHTLPHTCGINISFNNDDDTQMCLLCQLPGLAFCLPLISPPRVRAGLLSHGPDAHRPAGPGWAKGADLI